MVVTRPDGVVVSWGASIAQLTGFTADDAVGAVSPLRPAGSQAQQDFRRACAGALATGRTTYTHTALRADGGELRLTTTLHLLLDPEGTSSLVEVHRVVVVGESQPARVQSDAELLEQVVGHAVVRLDQSGVVRSWSLGAARVNGYAAHEIVGRHFSVFYTEDDRREGRPEHLLTVARREGLARDVGWRLRAGGTRFWGEIAINALHDPTGDVVGFLKVTRDLTAQKLRAAEAQRIYRALGHDLRNPLAAARGYVALATEALAEDGDDGADPAEFLRRSGVALGRLSTMLDELLRTVSLVEADADATGTTRERVRRAAVTVVGSALRQALDDLAVTHDVSRVRTDVVDVRARVDPLDLERVLANLVSNALRYSEGDVDVRVREEAGAAVRIAVSDAGRGIHPDDLSTIFELGRRGRLADDGDGGHGDGLASVRHLVEANGGDVSIVSAPGSGTTVEVVLSHAG